MQSCYNINMNNNFLPTHACVKNFHFRTENELNVGQIGYHDFRAIPPFKSDKIQKFWTIHLVVSGKGTLHYNGNFYSLSANDIFVLPPNELIGYYPDPSDPWDYIFFTFTGTYVPQYLQDIGFSSEEPIRTCKNPSAILPLFKAFFEKHHAKIPVSYFETTALLFQLFNAACAAHSQAIEEIKPDLVNEAISLIELHYLSSSLTVQYIADTLFVSHASLCKRFKEKTGQTVIAYINQRRMEYAEELLCNTSLTATQIAYMSGFNEYTYFLLKFKNKHKMTTQEYREKHQKR